jgi:hypothetical protein
MSFDAPGPDPATPDPVPPVPVPPVPLAEGKDVQAPLVPPSPARRRPLRWPLLALAGVAAIALVAGLIVWHPWDPPPAAPAALHGTSPTATSVRLAWPASAGGGTPGHYLVLRDGRQAAEVPASQTTWTDQGLAPGTTHRYTVKAAGSGGTSGPSVAATVTTLTPSPVGLRVVTKNWVSVTLAWRPSPLGPVPSQYVIYYGGAPVGTVPGTTNMYVDQAATPGETFHYTVVAQWGAHESRPSAQVTGSTTAAALNGNVPVTVTTTSIPSGSTGPYTGEVKNYTWNFSPNCFATGCPQVHTDGAFPTSAGGYTYFTVTLTASGDTYSGTVTGLSAHCESTNITETLTVRLTANKGQVSNGAWRDWIGTAVLTSPYTSTGGGSYCPTSSWDFSLSGKS